MLEEKKNVILACAGWKDKVNIEDTLFAGAVISRLKDGFEINCDASNMAATLYLQGRDDLYTFLKRNNASHYHRLMNFGLERDIRLCLTPDVANVLPYYQNERLMVY